MNRYVSEFATRYNMRNRDTIRMMSDTARMMRGKRLTYKNLIGANQQREEDKTAQAVLNYRKPSKAPKPKRLKPNKKPKDVTRQDDCLDGKLSQE